MTLKKEIEFFERANGEKDSLSLAFSLTLFLSLSLMHVNERKGQRVSEWKRRGKESRGKHTVKCHGEGKRVNQMMRKKMMKISLLSFSLLLFSILSSLCFFFRSEFFFSSFSLRTVRSCSATVDLYQKNSVRFFDTSNFGTSDFDTNDDCWLLEWNEIFHYRHNTYTWIFLYIFRWNVTKYVM